MCEDTWHAYLAGFFDADGSFCISRVKMGSFSDNHRIILDVAQHIDRIGVLNDMQRDFGGKVSIKRQNAKSYQPQATIANWHLQKKEDVERFVRAIFPYLRCKRLQAEITLEFIAVSTVSRKAVRTGGTSGHRFWSGTERLTDEQTALREQLRLRMREANRPSTRPILIDDAVDEHVE